MRYLFILLLLISLPAEAGCPKLFSGLVPQWWLKRRVFANYQGLLRDPAAHAYGIGDAIGEAMRRELEKMGFHPPHRVQDYVISPDFYLGRKSWDHRYALTHSGMPAALEEMKKAGYHLEVSNSLVADFAEGRTAPSEMAIKVLPHTSWPVFQHELHHMRAMKFGIGYGYTAIPAGITPTSREARMLADAAKLRAKSFGAKAIDETLAVRREITELEKIGYTPWSGPVYDARVYAWDYQIKSLQEQTKYGQGTRAQRARLRFIQAKKQLLRPIVVRAALVGAAVYYNEELERLLTRARDGTWQAFEFKDVAAEAD